MSKFKNGKYALSSKSDALCIPARKSTALYQSTRQLIEMAEEGALEHLDELAVLGTGISHFGEVLPAEWKEKYPGGNITSSEILPSSRLIT